MPKITIIGGGFSASVAKLLIKSPCSVITPKREPEATMFSRRALEINKAFSTRAKSCGSLKFEINDGKLHDRLILGGNSKIWGGFVNLSKLPKFLIYQFDTHGISAISLNFKDTGSVSNDPNVGQFQVAQGKIYDASILLNDSDAGYLESFFVDKNLIGLNLNCDGEKRTLFTDKLVLCVGTVQLLDLLYRSGFLQDKAIIKLTEFSYKVKLKFTFYPKKFLNSDGTIIRFNIVRAVSHLFGIQKTLKLCNYFKWIPLYVEQRFLHDRLECALEHQNGVIESHNQSHQYSNFGSSIHYCNMRINEESVNKILQKISPNIIGLGMPFVDQSKPGPISSDIVEDAVFKLQFL